MKTKEELNALKEEVETLNKKLAELTEDELAQVVGGAKWEFDYGHDIPDGKSYTVEERKNKDQKGLNLVY